jgi:hypothetical protein
MFSLRASRPLAGKHDDDAAVPEKSASSGSGSQDGAVPKKSRFQRDRYSNDAEVARSELFRDVEKARIHLYLCKDHIYGRSALISALFAVQHAFQIENLPSFYYGSKYGTVHKRQKCDNTIAAFLQHGDLIQQLRHTEQAPRVTGISAFDVEGFRGEPTHVKLEVVSAINGAVDKASVKEAYSALTFESSPDRISAGIRDMAKELGVVCDPDIIHTGEFKALFAQYHLNKLVKAASAYTQLCNSV